MLQGRFTIVGSTLLAAGMLVIGLAAGTGGGFVRTASAGIQCVTPGPSPTVTALQAAPACTPTQQVRLKTHTPTSTSTPAATSTEAPVTPPPANTPVPAPTQPTGGAAGGGVRPPDTGTGNGTAGESSAGVWLLLGGIAIAATGAGSVLVGVRRRS